MTTATTAPPLRTDEVARRLGVNVRTVTNTLQRNRVGDKSFLAEGVPAVYFARSWRVLREPFEAFVQAGGS